MQDENKINGNRKMGVVILKLSKIHKIHSSIFFIQFFYDFEASHDPRVTPIININEDVFVTYSYGGF